MAHFEQVYFDDLMSDEALNLVSDSAWKLWVKIFLYTGTKSPVRGKLLLANGETPDELQMSRIFSTEVRKLRRCISALERERVFDRDENGAIVCRRQWKEEQLRRERANSRLLAADNSQGVQTNSVKLPVEKTAFSEPNVPRAPACTRWNMEYGSHDQISDPDLTRARTRPVDSEPLGRSPTPLPVEAPAHSRPEDFIPNDATGHEELRALWNEHRAPELPECAELQRVESSALARLLGSDPRHRTKAWWVAWLRRTHTAKFLPHMNFSATLGWFVADEERIAALLRGQYDKAPEAKTAKTSSYRRPAGAVDYSRPLDDERGEP